jgi:prepilin-type N-terminal cleavage/methylation domain-containing protein
MPKLRHDQNGFGMIEVLAAILLVAIGIVGTLQAFISSDHANLATQRAQAVSTAAEQALEQMRATTYNSLALSALPVGSGTGNPSGDNSGDPLNPDYWVSGGDLKIPNNFAQTASGLLQTVATVGESLISGGTINPGPSTVTSDGFTVTIYRYVTWLQDSCLFGALNLCPGIDDAKRLTVAAVLSGGNLKPFWLTTIVANPNA